MKKLTLDETWELCLEIWRWVVREKKKRPEVDVWDLKLEWLAKFRPNDRLECECYFCEYAGHRVSGDMCRNGWVGCPGKLVHRQFDCCAESYHFESRPAAFLRKLESLNKKRLAAKKEKPKT